MDNDKAQGFRPLVSVIMPTYNRVGTLPRAIRSVLAQTWENLELIVADDASTDETRTLIAGISDRRIRYFRHRINRGAAAARNLGLANARGNYIAFQDSDDEWLLDKLAMQIEVLRLHAGQFGATFGGKLLYGRDPKGRFGDGLSDYRPHFAHAVRSGWITSQLLNQNLISPQTLLVEASVVRETGGFDERLSNNEDWEFMLRLSIRTRILFTNRPVVVAYISGDSITRNRHSTARAFITIMKKHNVLFRGSPVTYAQKLFATGRYLHQLGRYKAAQKFLLRALRCRPWSARIWLRLLHAKLAATIPAGSRMNPPGKAVTRVPAISRFLARPGAARTQALASNLSVVPLSRNVPERHAERADTH